MLPETVETVLAQFVTAMNEAFGDDLGALVLFGSAADETLRATSDVNVLVVLRRFDLAKAERGRPALELARAAIRLSPMFVLESELPRAARAFAVKFADILRRRRVLYGIDPLTGIVVPRAARIARLQQVLLNLALRLRADLVARGGREEQLALALARAAAPLRTSAATLLELEGSPPATPKESLARVAHEFDRERADRLLPEISRAREGLRITPDTGGATALFLVDLALAMGARVDRLTTGSAP